MRAVLIVELRLRHRSSDGHATDGVGVGQLGQSSPLPALPSELWLLILAAAHRQHWPAETQNDRRTNIPDPPPHDFADPPLAESEEAVQLLDANDH